MKLKEVVKAASCDAFLGAFVPFAPTGAKMNADSLRQLYETQSTFHETYLSEAPTRTRGSLFEKQYYLKAASEMDNGVCRLRNQDVGDVTLLADIHAKPERGEAMTKADVATDLGSYAVGLSSTASALFGSETGGIIGLGIVAGRGGYTGVKSLQASVSKESIRSLPMSEYPSFHENILEPAIKKGRRSAEKTTIPKSGVGAWKTPLTYERQSSEYETHKFLGIRKV